MSLDDMPGNAVSWKDITEALKWLERSQDVVATIFMHCQLSENKQYWGLLIVVKAERNGPSYEGSKVLTKTIFWPHRDHKTMPSALYRLIYELSDLCEENKIRVLSLQQE